MIRRTPAAVTTPGRLYEGCPGEGGGGGGGYSDMAGSPSSAHVRKTSGYTRANCRPPNALEQGTWASPGEAARPRDMGSYVFVNAEEASRDPSNSGDEQRPVPEGEVTVRPDGLLVLQETDLSLGRLRARLEELEVGEDLRMARARLGDAEARLSEVRLSMSTVDLDQRRLEGDIDSMQRKIDAETKRLFDGTVANAKELQSIEAEVESLKARKSRMEDRLLEQMEQGEELGERLKPVEAEVAEAKQRAAELEESSGKELVAIEKAISEREAERADLALELDEGLLQLYEDIRRQKKGVGAAALIDGVCQACHQKLSPVYLDRLKRSDDIRRCEYCRRILVVA
jgi:predicted  nucleic acid-binding Zn-ribbon protein